MAVPDFQSFLKPFLDLASDGQEHSMREAKEKLALTMGMSEEDLHQRLPSGRQATYDNRVHWAKAYFIQAEVLESTRRGHFRITERGRELHRQGHERIDVRILKQYPEFREFSSPNRARTEDQTDQDNDALDASLESATPVEIIQKAYESIRSELAIDLLSQINSNSPQFFERLVVDLMVAMGYGGSRAEAGESIGGSGDEGIDGIIKEDKLGLDVIYLQAKRWEGSVGRPEMQKFVGALHGKGASKGVFITTSKFTAEAKDYTANMRAPKVILIDGRALAEYMIDHDIGTSVVMNYEIKRVDSDYFDED